MRAASLILSIVLVAAMATAQMDTATVRIIQASGCDVSISLEQLRSLPQHTATVISKDGESHHYGGPLLQRVLNKACPTIAAMDKHARTAAAVKVTAQDGFVAVLGAMELGSTFKVQPVLLALERDGHPLDAHYGPFQLVVPEDLRHSRNVRNVGKIEWVTP